MDEFWQIDRLESAIKDLGFWDWSPRAFSIGTRVLVSIRRGKKLSAPMGAFEFRRRQEQRLAKGELDSSLRLPITTMSSSFWCDWRKLNSEIGN